MGAGNIDRFLHQMSTGDLLLTVDGQKVYVGRIAAEPEKPELGSLERARGQQRRVDWLNTDNPLYRAARLLLR